MVTNSMRLPIQQANDSAGKTSAPRMKAPAAYNAAKAVGDAAGSGNPASVGVSADLGHSQSQSQLSQRSDSALGSRQATRRGQSQCRVKFRVSERTVAKCQQIHNGPKSHKSC